MQIGRSFVTKFKIFLHAAVANTANNVTADAATPLLHSLLLMTSSSLLLLLLLLLLLQLLQLLLQLLLLLLPLLKTKDHNWNKNSSSNNSNNTKKRNKFILKRVEIFSRYLRRNDRRCTCEIKSRLPWQKLHSTRRRIFLPAHWT